METKRRAQVKQGVVNRLLLSGSEIVGALSFQYVCLLINTQYVRIILKNLDEIINEVKQVLICSNPSMTHAVRPLHQYPPCEDYRPS